MPKPATKIGGVTPLQPPLVWIKDKAQEGNALPHRPGVCSRVNLQSQCPEIILNLLFPTPELPLRIREQQKIINIAQVRFAVSFRQACMK